MDQNNPLMEAMQSRGLLPGQGGGQDQAAMSDGSTPPPDQQGMVSQPLSMLDQAKMGQASMIVKGLLDYLKRIAPADNAAGV